MNKKVRIPVSVILLAILIFNCILLFGSRIHGISDTLLKAGVMIISGGFFIYLLSLVLIGHSSASSKEFGCLNIVMFVAAASLTFFTVVAGLIKIFFSSCS